MRVQKCRELLAIHNEDPDGFFAKMVTGYESWFHYYTPEEKRQSMQWKHDGSSRPKKFWRAPSAGKQMATVFWDTEVILMVEWLPQGTTVNSVIYCGILTQLCQKIQQWHKNKWE
jgi:hypothetical protein